MTHKLFGHTVAASAPHNDLAALLEQGEELLISLDCMRAQIDALATTLDATLRALRKRR